MQSSNLITVPHKFEPRSYQLELFQAMDSGINRGLLIWARRAGKDKACMNYMIKKMFERVGVYYYFFPTYEQGRKALWENIDAAGLKMLAHIPESEIARISNQQMIIELKNGSVFRVVAADQVEQSIVGTNPVGMVFSEFSLQDPSGWKLMAPVARENKGWVIFNGTPRGRNHMYDMFQRVKHVDNWYTSFRPINELGVYTEEEIVNIIEECKLEGMTQDEIDQELFCSFSAGMRGAYYAAAIELARKQGRIGDFVPDMERWVDTFWDLGMDDSTAIWFRQVVGNKIVFVDYFEDSNKPISHYVKILQDKGYNYRTHWLPHDGNHNNLQTGKTTREILVETLESSGIASDVVCVPKIGLQDGINSTRKRFSRYFFNEGLCAEGLKALEAYHKRFDSKRQAFIQQPVHDWSSHCADAIRTEALAEDYFEDESAVQFKVNHTFSPFD